MKYEFTSEEVASILAFHLVKKNLLNLDLIDKGGKQGEIEAHNRNGELVVTLELPLTD